ncbi:glutathione S-transferase kappa 1-like [Dysidea avara]|uniref:glutathione S-transferase kappa 1-like n=1 Tax=Dysidea avara TaxID=196820 RepID=UPI0033199BE2
MSQQIKLYYDVMSPYSYIGFEVLHQYKQKWNFHLQLCPFVLPRVRELSGNHSQNVPLKAQYVGQDVARLAEYYCIPLNPPPPSKLAEALFVKGTLRAQLLLTAANLEYPDSVEAISRKLFMRLWAKDEDITEDASLIQACVKAGIVKEEARKLLARSKDQNVKEKLEATTQEAFGFGAFGAPFMVVMKDKPEVFWGQDRIELMGHTLGLKWEGPLVIKTNHNSSSQSVDKSRDSTVFTSLTKWMILLVPIIILIVLQWLNY